MKQLGTLFLTGLLTIIPLAATVWLLIWLADTMETALGPLIRLVLPRGYLPGMGIAAGLVVVVLIGLLMHTLLMRALMSWVERVFLSIPLVKSVYGFIQDFLNYFSHQTAADQRMVVAVPVGQSGAHMIGFVTRQDLAGTPLAAGVDDPVSVYIPFSYQIGGHLVLVPRSAIRPLDISAREAARFLLTGGIASTGERRDTK